jgi:hypothetical protein
MMKMLEAGGLQVFTDNLRTADEQNPKGYFEFERVKDLHNETDKSWVRGARGKALKVVSSLLGSLPEDNNYQVVFMERNLQEVIASQNKMLVARGEASAESSDAALAGMYREHLDRVRRLLERRACFDAVYVTYSDVVKNPRTEAKRVSAFLDGRVSAEKMATAVDEQLYRNRR